MARVAPHVVDTLLPATALATPVAARLDPPAMPRLAAKLVALVGYIVPGATALRHGRTRAMRILALAGTPPALAFIFAAPITRSPLAPFG